MMSPQANKLYREALINSLYSTVTQGCRKHTESGTPFGSATREKRVGMACWRWGGGRLRAHVPQMLVEFPKINWIGEGINLQGPPLGYVSLSVGLQWSAVLLLTYSVQRNPSKRGVCFFPTTLLKTQLQVFGNPWLHWGDSHKPWLAVKRGRQLPISSCRESITSLLAAVQLCLVLCPLLQ